MNIVDIRIKHFKEHFTPNNYRILVSNISYKFSPRNLFLFLLIRLLVISLLCDVNFPLKFCKSKSWIHFIWSTVIRSTVIWSTFIPSSRGLIFDRLNFRKEKLLLASKRCCTIYELNLDNGRDEVVIAAEKIHDIWLSITNHFAYKTMVVKYFHITFTTNNNFIELYNAFLSGGMFTFNVLLKGISTDG